MFLHSDQDYVPAPFPPYALVANIMWFIDDFTADNGATRIVPLSHTKLRPPNYAKQYESVPVTGPRGTMTRLRQLLGYEMWLGGVGGIGGLPRNGPRF